MKPIIDIHSHMLPKVDDGCSSKAEALTMLRMYEEQGVEAVVCTPHYGPCAITGANVNDTFQWLSSQPSSVKLYLGNEALAGSFRPGSPHGPRRIADTLLLEFEEWGITHTGLAYILNRLSYFSTHVGPVILAHPERYRDLRLNPWAYKEITKMGVKLQINAYDIFDTETEETKITTRWLLSNRMVSYLGSDAHGAIRRAPMMTNGVRWIYDHCEETYADAIVHDNAARLLKKGEA